MSGIFVPSFRKNQRAKNVASMCLFFIPSFPRSAIKYCCWKYLPRRISASAVHRIVTVRRPRFSEFLGFPLVDLNYLTNQFRDFLCRLLTDLRAGGLRRHREIFISSPGMPKPTRASSAAIAYYCFINEFLLLLALPAFILTELPDYLTS